MDNQIDQSVKDFEYYIPNDNELTTVGKTWDILITSIIGMSVFVIWTQLDVIWDIIQSRKRKDYN